MKNEIIAQKLERLNKDATLQNYFAQANARYILLNTQEEKNNFPSYTIQDKHLNLLALQYLNLGCSYAENQAFSLASTPLEKGASLLEVVHAVPANRTNTSNYYGLIAALAYYVGFEYSKAFILISKFDASTVVASLIRQFLLRNFSELTAQLYPILVSEDYSDALISEMGEQEGSQKIYEFIIAKALDGFVKFYLSGDQDILARSKSLLSDGKEIAGLEEDAGIWWVFRLLLLISQGFSEAAVWNVLPKYFDMEDEQVKGYVRSLVYMRPKGHYELFISQRASLEKVIGEDLGCVVSIPTSSGKTRIAEIAILNAIKTNPNGKILYIAPFRSLAFEVESSLEKVFEHSEIIISHLYGGSLYSKLDEMSVEDANVIIATPEKAKAILRANSDVVSKISLAILDEGHLLGADKRLIMNEMFYEELRYYIQRNNGNFLVLSAVLPNAEDLAKWLTGSSETVARNTWRPSEERLGIMEWRSNNVSLNWESQDHERSSFNPRFVTAEVLKKYKYRGEERVKYFPGDKNEAVAATAYRLRNFGPVLIFVGIKGSVFTMARAYLKVLGAKSEDHIWAKQTEWRAYEMACEETYGENNEWTEFARKGILCHHGGLQGDVRLPLERLMREDKPLVIISTSTLGQGVNLGVSTVIFSTLHQAGNELKARDFWNIAGRAGRAFIDHEGKILVAIDTNGKSTRDRGIIFKYVRDNYFDKEKIDHAQSGILALIVALKNFAQQNGISFELLLELITENKVSEIGDQAMNIDEILDWIDDTLLSLLLLNNPDGNIDLGWVEDFFSKSLAYIQASESKSISPGQLIDFVKSRTKGIAAKVGYDRDKWASIVTSGIPLNSDLILEEKIDDIIFVVDAYSIIFDDIDQKIGLLREIEYIIRGIPILNEDSQYLDYPKIDEIRENWLKGIKASEMLGIAHASNVISDIYSYSLPWILNGIAKKLNNKEEDALAEIVEELAILVEAGLPSLTRVKIYQCGIRSRSAANELGDFIPNSLADAPISAFKKELVLNAENYIPFISSESAEWLEMLQRYSSRNRTRVKIVRPFTFGNVHKKTTLLIARTIRDRKYLLSPDLTFIFEGWGNIDFSEVAEHQGISFVYNEFAKQWEITNNNPYLEIDK
ncbi:DEAD/DEAH box helicase [Pedobacter sp. MR22-3]|uniref:DEAD/DEAH box helicase n=1 Tax=Pedobacter sp. MR22-3 TaxID=2994552 RepID=UPI0022460972|nr:DEAD/DEAH box helicase [Pedobacter sp. MR22-3]MCX2584792.1 DEAD/DEAH box helicase [Pedobacter sp. MR22-3]